MSSFDAVYERIKFATKARTQVELASLLEIRQSSISDAKRRRSVPAEWFLKLHDKFGLSIDWLRWEAGPMFSREAPREPFSRERLSADTADSLKGKRMAVSAEAPPDASPGTSPEASSGAYAKPGKVDLALPRSPDGSVMRDAVLREDAPTLAMPKGLVTPILNMAFDYVEGEGIPDFTVRNHMVLPFSLMDEGVRVFYVETGGMTPTLRRGGCVGVSTRQQHLVSGEVFALLMPHEGVAFRRIVQDSESGLYLLCFDQAGLPSTRLPAKALQSRVLGKVLWTLQPV